MGSTRLRRILVAVFLLVLVLPAASQAPSDPVSSELVANVLKLDGSPVRDLSKDNFRIVIGGKPAQVLDASYSLAPRRLVVLLDVSGSMAGTVDNTKWQVAREVVRSTLADMPAGVSIALLTFSDKINEVFDFGQTRESMTAWLNAEGKNQNPRVHGRTAVLDAVSAAAKFLNQPRPGDAIYLVTDGDDNISQVRAKKIRELLVHSKIRLFMFLLVDQPGCREAGLDRDQYLEGLVSATGGFIFGVRAERPRNHFPPALDTYTYNESTRETIKERTRELNARLVGFYTLRFQQPVVPAKAHEIALDVVDGAGKRMPVTYTYSAALQP